MIIKAQSLIRGMLARKKVKSIYGYSMTPGLFRRINGNYLIEMDPIKLEE